MADRLWMLSDLLAATMLCVAAYCTGRLVLSLRSSRRTQRDADLVHTVMGVSMAGMLAPSLVAVPTGLWVGVFSASTLWFGWRVVRDAEIETVGAHPLGQHLPHLLMSAAMVYMLIVAEWTGSMGAAHGSAMLGMSAADASARWPLLTIVLAILLLGDGVFTFGRNLRRTMPAFPQGVLVRVGTNDPVRMHDAARGDGSMHRDTRTGSAPGVLLAPRSIMVCQLVMSLVMGYMLVSLL
jgi:Domain of unknown function (DUF5134)